MTLTVYALDSAGQVLAHSNAFVSTVAERDTVPFSVRLKVGAELASVRAAA